MTSLKNITLKIASIYDHASGVVKKCFFLGKNILTRSPERDCFVSVSQKVPTRGHAIKLPEISINKAQKDIPKRLVVKSPKIKNQKDLERHLKELKDKNANSRLDASGIRRIVSSADTPEKATFKFDLTHKLAQRTNRRFI